MSIWGKRVDAWFDRKTGLADMSPADREAGAWRLVAILAVVVVLAVLAVYASR